MKKSFLGLILFCCMGLIVTSCNDDENTSGYDVIRYVYPLLSQMTFQQHRLKLWAGISYAVFSSCGQKESLQEWYIGRKLQ